MNAQIIHPIISLAAKTGQESENKKEEQTMETPKIKAIIFDCDGLLLDTEPLYTLASQKVLENHGVAGEVYNDDVRRHIIGVCEIEGNFFSFFFSSFFFLIFYLDQKALLVH